MSTAEERKHGFQTGVKIGRYLRLLTDCSLGIWFLIAWLYGDIASMIGTGSLLIYFEALEAKHNSEACFKMSGIAIDYLRRQEYKAARFNADPRYDFGAPEETPENAKG